MKKTLDLLAVDYGASGGKAFVGRFDGSGLSLGEVHRFDNAPCHVHSSMYWDIFKLFEELKAAARAALKSGADIAGLAVDTWATDFGALDSKGNLIGSPHSYMDSRTESVADEVFAAFPEYELFKIAGGEPHPRFALFQLFAMQRNEPDILENTKTLLFMPNLINYFCTGEIACEATQASTTLLYDPFKRDWNAGIFNKLGLTNLFPPIGSDVSVLGGITPSLSGDTGLSAGTKVLSIPHHDSASAMLPASHGETLFVNSGSWSIIGTYIDEPIVTREAFECKYNNHTGYNGKVMFTKHILGHYILHRCMGEWADGGRTVAYGGLEAAARASSFTSHIDFGDNWFNLPGGTLNCIAEHCKRRGMDTPGAPEEFYLCILRGLAKEYAKTLNELKRITGKTFSRAHIVGGGSMSPLFCGLVATETGLPVVAGPSEATAAGNILAQLISLGEVKDEAEAALIAGTSFGVKEYLPSPR